MSARVYLAKLCITVTSGLSQLICQIRNSLSFVTKHMIYSHNREPPDNVGGGHQGQMDGEL